MVADLSVAADRDKVVAAFPDIDVLVNNAGAIPGGTLDEVDDAAWRAGWDLKVFGYINMTRAYLKRMRARGSGVIVNVIGAAGESLRESYIAGSVGNASLMAFTRSIGTKSPDWGVRIVGVNPGPVETERIEVLGRKRAAREFGDENRWRDYFKVMPFGRPAHARRGVSADRVPGVRPVGLHLRRGLHRRRRHFAAAGDVCAPQCGAIYRHPSGPAQRARGATQSGPARSASSSAAALRRCAAILRLVGAFRDVRVAVDHLQVGKAPEAEQHGPGRVAVLAPHPEQRHAVIDLGGLPQPLTALRAAPRLDALEDARMIARRVPQPPRHHAGGVPFGIAVRSAIPQVDVPAEAEDRLPAHAAVARAARERGLAIGRGRRAEA